MEDVDKKMGDLVEKAQDESFKAAIQKWSSNKPKQTIVNEIGKLLKGNQPKCFLAWLLAVDVQDEALKKYKLKNDFIKQSVLEIEKLVQNDQQVEKEDCDAQSVSNQKDTKGDSMNDKEVIIETQKDIENDDQEETRSIEGGENIYTVGEDDKEKNINEDNDKKVKSADNDNEQSNSAIQNFKENTNDAPETLIIHEKSIEINKNCIGEAINDAASIVALEKKTAFLAIQSNKNDNKHSEEENSKKDHLAEEETHKKGHYSVEVNSKKVHISEENKENKKTPLTEAEHKNLPSVLSQSEHNVIHKKEHKLKLKCELCNGCYEATNKSTVSCGNCKNPAHDDCLKKVFNGCDLKMVLEKVGGLNLIWLCSDCNPSCKVVVVNEVEEVKEVVEKEKTKKTSQSTQTKSHEKENRSQPTKDKNSQKKDEEKTTEEKVNSIRRKLEKVLESGGSNKKTLELLKSLEKLSEINSFLAESINLNILTSTKIGWTINDVRKNSTDYDVIELAIRLIKKWKKIVPEHYRGDEAAETPKKRKTVKQNDLKSVLIELPIDKKENTTSSKTKEKDSVKDNKSKVKETDKMKENKPKKKETIKASFFENIKKDVEKKEIKKDFEDDEKSVRKTSNNMLLAAVKGDGSLPDDTKADVDKLAASIEEAMFCLSKQVNKHYKNLVRSRVFNIKTNPALRAGLLNENISPARLVSMSSEDMANTNVKNQRDKFCQEGLERFVKTFGDMQLQGNPDLKITDFKIPKYLAPLTAATGSSPTVSGLPSASKVSDLTNAGYYSLK